VVAKLLFEFNYRGEIFNKSAEWAKKVTPLSTARLIVKHICIQFKQL